MNADVAFCYLKPLCIQVAQQPTVRSLNNLRGGLQSVERSLLNEKGMAEYIIFPLKLTIQRIDRKNEKLLIKTLECMAFVFELVVMKSELLFMEMFDIFCVLLSSMKQPNGKEMIALISEEVKLSITVCMTNLLQNSCKSVLICLFNKGMLPRLGHAVSLLLALLEYEVERNLRLKALECLGNITLKHKTLSEPELQMIGDVFCSFIPGISLSFSRILTDQVNVGQNLVSAITEAFKDFVTLVMSDSKFSFAKSAEVKNSLLQRMHEIQQNNSLEKETSHTPTVERQINDIMVQRNDDWMKETSSKLQILIEKVIHRVACDSSFKVRQAAVVFAETIILECRISMRSCTPVLLEILVSMQNDEHEKVSTEVDKAIKKVQSIIEKDGGSLYTFVEGKLYERLLALPRIMRGADDDQKLMFLNIIAGYFNLLESQISKVLNSMVMLEKIIKSFIQILELDTNDVKIVEERNTISSEEMVSNKHYDGTNLTDAELYRFKNFKDPRIFLMIRKICLAIGTFSDLQIIVDYLLDKFVSSSHQRKENVFLLNEILRSRHDSKTKTICSTVIEQVLSTFFHEEFWYLPTTNVVSADIGEKGVLEYQLGLTKAEKYSKDLIYWEQGIPVTQINSNIQLICLMLNGVSVCSGVMMGKFNVYLIKVLYPVLEKLGDQNAQIARCAQNTLDIVSHNCGEKSTATLLLKNADYLVNSVSLSLRNSTLFSSAPSVLSMMLVYSNMEILPIVADVMQDVFNCLDLYQEEVTFSLMKVLKSFVSSVNTWFGDELTKEKDGQEHEYQKACRDLLSPKDLKCFLEDYCKLKLEALGNFDDDIGEEVTVEAQSLVDDLNDKAQDNKEGKKKIPLHYQTTLMALKKCQHFLPSKDTRLKLLILDVIEVSVQALKSQQNDLLPALHKIWPAVAARMKDPNQVIATRTLEVICTTIACSGDFLRQRVRKEIFPFAMEFLKKETSSSLKRSNSYKFSSIFKLQRRLLSVIGSIVENLGLPDEELLDVISVCSKYLDCRQPEVLQMEAIKTLKIAKMADWDQTWLVLTSMYCPKELVAPNSQFKDVSIDNNIYKRNEFADNVVQILYSSS